MSITFDPQATRTVIEQDGVAVAYINDNGSLELVNPPVAPTGNMVTSFNQFGSSLSTNGYQKLPSGLIIQWGNTGSISGGGTQTNITLPIACPTGLCSVSLVANTSTSYVGTVLSFTTTKFTAVNHGASPANFFYIAIGY